MKKAGEDFKDAVKNSGDNPKKITEADVRFHDIILKSSGNERLVMLVNNLAEHLYRYRLEYIKVSSALYLGFIPCYLITDAKR